MSPKISLGGLRVQMTLDDDGTPNPPQLPQGTIVRSIIGVDGVTYYQVHLDRPVTCLRAKTKAEWTLNDLIIAPYWKGQSIAEYLRSSTEGTFLPISIANMLRSIERDEPVFDFSKVAYFALGALRRV